MVVGVAPSSCSIIAERIGPHDQDDQQICAAARLALDLPLPVDWAGPNALLTPIHWVVWLQVLSVVAIGGFIRLSPKADQVLVSRGKSMNWQN